jgi:hypothetical protein
MGPNPVVTHGSVRDGPRFSGRFHSSIPGDPGRHASGFVAAALDRRCRTGQGSTFVARCAETELTSPLRPTGKRCDGCLSSVPGRVEQCHPRIPSTDRQYEHEALRGKGYRGAGNSGSTLGQSSRQSSTVRATLRQGFRAGRAAPVSDGFRPVGDASRSVAGQGLSGCGQLCVNSASTLRQLSVKGHGNRQGLRQLCVKGRMRRSRPRTGATPR